ncbi:MAG: response regulator transcription factor [Campylobacterales bacterium]
MRILYLEDDLLFGESVAELLEDSGFSVELVKTVDRVLEATFKESYDLYLFDINLPDGSGIKLLDDLKKSGDKTPSLFLTSFKDSQTLLKGFKSGCDDYIKKPCDPDELLVRINAILRRSGKLDSKRSFCGYEIDIKSRVAYKDGHALDVPKKIFNLMEVFSENPDSVVTQDLIASRLWDIDEEPSFGAIRVYINKLNKLLEGNKITNIKGVGYRLS